MVLKHRGYSAYITCGDSRLEEYGMATEDDATVSGYICSEAGKQCKNFVVHFDSERSFDSIGRSFDKLVRVYVDGQFARGRSANGGAESDIDGFRVNSSEIRLFKFQNIATTDLDTAASGHHQDLGCIEIRIRRIFLMPGTGAFIHQPERMPAVITTVHETSKKLGSHCVGIGETIKKVAWNSKCERYDKEDYVKFRFYYRRRDILQAQGIVSEPVKPKNLPQSHARTLKREHESDDDDDDDDTLKKLQADISSQQEKLSSQQAQLAKMISRKGGKHVKQEPVFNFLPNEVIDLT